MTKVPLILHFKHLIINDKGSSKWLGVGRKALGILCPIL